MSVAPKHVTDNAGTGKPRLSTSQIWNMSLGFLGIQAGFALQNSNASGNRLSVGFHLVFKNTLDVSKNFESDISRNFDFPATQSLSEAENVLTNEIVKNLADEIFNKIFSNW